MTHRVLYDASFFEILLQDCSINVTEMFRDPDYFEALRQEIVPYLRTYPFFRIWVPGCASGEEVYSIAILLYEEGLYERAQIYATDFNDAILDQASQGIYPLESIREYTTNYQRAGGSAAFSDYYIADHQAATLNQSLKKNIVFANHNLASDKAFNEMHFISCRNVLIYFNKTLKDRVIQLFKNSLSAGGFLCLGTKESLKFSKFNQDFEVVSKDDSIYRKKSDQSRSDRMFSRGTGSTQNIAS